MEIETFLLERNQTLYENDVEFNLTESGVHPFSLREIMEVEELEALVRTPLGYGHTDGRPGLKSAIAQWYPAAGAENVAIVHGASEANLLALLTILSPGDELIFLLPNFMQISGLATALGICVRPLLMREADGWQPNLDAVAQLITPRTRIIAFANPGNPTGQVFTRETMEGLAAIAAGHGCYLLSDEIYRGAEIDREETPTFFGFYDRVIVTSSLSKSFANPGLRLGWMVAPPKVIIEVMRRQDYTSIGTGILSQLVAEKVMQPATRDSVLNRSRTVLSANVKSLESWLEARRNVLSWCRPQAGGIAFLRYDLPLSSSHLVASLREEEGVFVVAGDWFGLDGHIRIGTGGDAGELLAALNRFDRFLHRQLSRPGCR